MALIFNGVTIRDDVAEVLSFNGGNIEAVIFDGVEVWKQWLFHALWSGDSLAATPVTGLPTGIETSGSSHRVSGGTGTGAWVASGASLGAGTSTAKYGFTDNNMSIITTSSTLRLTITTYATTGTVGFANRGGFTDSSAVLATKIIFETSAEQLRCNVTTGVAGDWITLT